MLERDEEREEFLEQNREPSEEALGDDELLEPAIGEGLVETLAEELEEDLECFLADRPIRARRRRRRREGPVGHGAPGAARRTSS